ncbi:LutC/YkgG family protein [Desulforhopalus singaporensis]|uniref:L-lactate dehydrogenase complex protein LldG n=1 Tax=Desulforhopalus singaporensis TaxID=91360 RepID=A0A1H0PRL6_9BACT|nr:lactate utilization protein [Desulforhopalus singaporensis]SDP07196.1 L-lactate dehydrogenase complex protein LldG [Desulforhopalus singaporensis]
MQPTPEPSADFLAEFVTKARNMAAIVTSIAKEEEVIAYLLGLGAQKKVSGESCLVAAAGLMPHNFQAMAEACQQKGIRCINSGLRAYQDSLDIGISMADFGIAETGTLVLSCPQEDHRLISMICDYHICIVRAQNMCRDSFAAARQLAKFTHATPNYTAFITGPSRTADIERVLTIGVHGPLELHILILEEN